ncbi:MAG: zinc D-Ala-D-Ala carboxypeptidase [Kribbellaceae bacterium]|jgi:LAS superfamily LD-carboxypeptidase LdcB|nr:zinc D-Ala-D-Ala carboxypeptidase [Kribbellaceae bacterium]
MLPDELVATRKKMRRLTVLVVVAIVVAVICFAFAACTSVDNTHSTTSAPAGSGAPDPVKSTKHHRGDPGPEDGVLPDNASPFDTSLPGVANLNPELLKAVQDAARAAENAGIKLHLTTGWRSKEYQKELLDKAIKRYGSREKAREYVATPEESHHVTGNAVDVGPTDADDWLNRKGARFGLCQTLANEIWHFELVTTPGGACPPMKSTSSSR